MVDGFNILLFARVCPTTFRLYVIVLSAREPRVYADLLSAFYFRELAARGRKFPSICPCVSVRFESIFLRERKRLFWNYLFFFGVLNHFKHLVTFFQIFKSTIFYLPPQFSLSSAYPIHVPECRISSQFRSHSPRCDSTETTRRFRARGRQLISLSFS